MKCVICNTSGSANPKEIIIQSTPSGLVCSNCISILVADVVHMRKPWAKRDLKDWGEEE